MIRISSLLAAAGFALVSFAAAAQDATHRRNSGIVLARPHRRRAALGIHDHGAELVDGKRPAKIDQYASIATAAIRVEPQPAHAAISAAPVDPDPLLAIENGTGRGNLDHESGHEHQGRKHHQTQQADGNVFRPLPFHLTAQVEWMQRVPAHKGPPHRLGDQPGKADIAASGTFVTESHHSDPRRNLPNRTTLRRSRR